MRAIRPACPMCSHRRRLSLLVVAVAFCLAALDVRGDAHHRVAATQAAVADSSPEFSPEIWVAHVHYLASDELGGRGVGTEGIHRATRYIADCFKRIGLQPGGENGSYFQTFSLHAGAVRTDDGELIVEGIESTPKFDQDCTPLPFSTGDAFAGDVVFCGYGISSAERRHDDYRDTDVTGKVVLIFRREPPAWEPEEGHFTPYALFQRKVVNAQNRGAAAVLVVNQALADGEDDVLIGFRGRSDTLAYGLPAFHITRALAAEMLAAGGLESLDVLQGRVDAGEFRTAPLSGVRVRGQAGIRWYSPQVRNVIGILPGRGPRADEFVVLGAHHDHLGNCVSGEGYSRGPKGSDAPVIHNGADDNASGTAGVLELAAAFAAGPPLDRSLVFMTFTAEEAGLLGSQHFVTHPTFSLEKTVAMLNLDMIGRVPVGGNRVRVFGTGSGEGLQKAVDDASARADMPVESIGLGLGGSDHLWFYRYNIPVLHFYSGQHEDYHTPSDDTARINEQDAVRIVGLVYEIARHLASAATPVAFHKPGAADPGRRRHGYKLVTGIIPSFDEPAGTGMKVAFVTPGSPAVAAGLLGGDRLMKVDDKPVNSAMEFIDALAGHEPGDVLTLAVKRDDEELTLALVLVAAD